MHYKRDNYLFSTIGMFIFFYVCFFNSLKLINISYVFVLGLGLILILFDFILKKEKITNIRINYVLLLFIFFSVVSLSYSKAFNSSIRMIITYFLFFLISIFINYKTEFWIKIKKLLLIFCSITLIVTILTFISKETYIKYFLPFIYKDSQTIVYNLIMYGNSFPGIFASTGLNAFFISVGYYILFFDILNSNKKNKMRILLLILYILGIFLTLKRIALLLNIFITTFLIILNLKRKNKFIIKKKSVMCFLGLVFLSTFFIIIFNDITLNLISRFFESGDFLNGRGDLYEFALTKIKENPLIGNGINSYSTLYNQKMGSLLSTHNEILQLTYELGLFQTIILFITMFWYLLNTYKKYKNIKYAKSTININFLLVSMAIQLYFILYCITGNPFHDMNVFCLYAIFVTLANDFKMEDNYEK